ncbi:MAG TPA: DUF1080 domain-containing protein [Opitutaceae bacterium]|nr:DUF1080 domain-containing protein [Opitutaceae bacterium]
MKLRLLLLALAALGHTALNAADRTLVMIAGPLSHPPLMHEFRAGSMLLQKRLQGYPGLKTVLITNGWPTKEVDGQKVDDHSVLANADAVFIYSDGGARHLALQGDRLEVLRKIVARGGGIGFAHYAVEVPADKGGAEWKEWVGGYYESAFSCNPIWEADYKTLPEHAITRGVKPFKTKDEWYFNMRFRDGKVGVKDILVAEPSDAVRDGPYVHPKGPYAHIQAAKGRPETMMWAVERADGGRGFGFTGGHFHLNWQNDDQRKLVLNALVWLAKLDVPANGVVSAPVSDEEAYQNLDDKKKPAATAALPFFDGKTLAGWKNPYSWGKAEVVNGEVHLTGDKKFFLVTEKTYGDFVFEGEVLLPAGKANSGFMFRAHVEPNKVFGYQAEVDGDESRGWSGGLYDEGRRMWFASPIKGDAKSEAAFRERSKGAFKRDQWNTFRITCRGPKIKIEVNGVTVTDIEDSMDARGVIGLQHHGEKGQTYRFRNLRIQEL